MPITGIMRNDKGLMVMDPFYKSFVRHNGKPGRNKAPRVPINLTMNLASDGWVPESVGVGPASGNDECLPIMRQLYVKGSSPMIRTPSVLLWIVGRVCPWRIVGQLWVVFGSDDLDCSYRQDGWVKTLKNAIGIIPRKQPPAHINFN